jgi:hypothetical protein
VRPEAAEGAHVVIVFLCAIAHFSCLIMTFAVSMLFAKAFLLLLELRV